MKYQRNGGVTLIALAITIIILLILAAVLINSFTGGSGILRNSKESAILASMEECKRAVSEIVSTKEAEIIKQGDYSAEATCNTLVEAGILKAVQVKEIEGQSDKIVYLVKKGKLPNFSGGYGHGDVPATPIVDDTSSFNDVFGVNPDFTIYYYSKVNKLYGDIKFSDGIVIADEDDDEIPPPSIPEINPNDVITMRRRFLSTGRSSRNSMVKFRK